jgi:carbon storage regulator
MLVLNRKKDESIILGNSIEIKILKTGKNFVEIGVEAPKNLSIYRKEIFLQIQKKNIEAIKSAGSSNMDNIKKLLKNIKS